MYIVIYIFAHFGREVCDELKRNFYESKKDRDSITEFFLKKKKKSSTHLLILDVDRLRLSLLKGSGLRVGLFLVPDYPILAATEGRFCQNAGQSAVVCFYFAVFSRKRRRIPLSSVYHSIIEYIHGVLFYCCILP